MEPMSRSGSHAKEEAPQSALVCLGNTALHAHFPLVGWGQHWCPWPSLWVLGPCCPRGLWCQEGQGSTCVLLCCP